jgi:hypothetical protein
LCTSLPPKRVEVIKKLPNPDPDPDPGPEPFDAVVNAAEDFENKDDLLSAA